jgi:5'-3' exonuclease
VTNILLIDLSSIAHPLWHVSASEPDPNATSTKTVERVRALASGQPHVAICCDSGRSFRKDISADYKATRPEHDAALQHQITLAMETLIADGFPVWFNKGFEADDLIATATHEAQRRWQETDYDGKVMIASSDKDLLQLVNGHVTVKSLTNGNEYDEDAVLLKFGVRPNQMRDWLSLVGDASDNIQGAKGIGAKGAMKLLTKYGNLEDLYTDLDKHGTNFTPALATSLREFQPRMATVRELITLRTDAPLPFDEIFRERVPQDVAIFGDEPVNDEAGRAADIAEAMPTLLDAQESAEHAYMAPRPRQDAPGPPIAVPNMAQAQLVPPEPYSPPTPASLGLSIVPRSYEMQLEPQTYAEAKALAADLFAARLFNGYGSAPAVLSTIIIGRELGLSAGASLRGFHIIDGKHAMAADLIRARVLASPVCEYFRCTERTAEKATFVTKRKGDPEIALTYTLDEGKQAFGRDESTPAAKSAAEKAWKASGWGKNAADMLVARCSSKLARLVYPDVVHGYYSPEEFD